MICNETGENENEIQESTNAKVPDASDKILWFCDDYCMGLEFYR